MSNVFRVELQPPPIINTVVECCEDSIQGAIKQAENDNLGWTPVAVNEIEILGQCEGCKRWLLDGDDYRIDADELLICCPCAIELKNHERQVAQQNDACYNKNCCGRG